MEIYFRGKICRNYKWIDFGDEEKGIKDIWVDDDIVVLRNVRFGKNRFG